MTVAELELHNLLQKAVENHRAGRRDMASQLYERVLSQDPDHPDALNLLGVIQLQKGFIDEAEQLMLHALRRAENNDTILNNLASVQLQKKDYSAAAATARRSIQIEPRNANAKKHLSSASLSLGQYAEAIRFAEEAMQDDPSKAELKVHLGTIQLGAHRPAEAVATLLSAFDVNRPDPVLDLHLGAAQRQLGLYEDALRSLERALAVRPDLPAALINRGNALASLNRPEDAMRDFQRALELQPQSATALNGLGKTLQILGHWSEALEALRLAWMLDDQQRGFDSSYLYVTSLSPALNRKQVADIHRVWGRAVEQATLTYSHRAPDPDQSRLTIGYVSPDFCSHATMRFFLPLIQQHDRSRVRVICYSENCQADEVTERVKWASDLWRSTSGLSDDEVAKQIVSDDVDVLIDLAGHTCGNRLRVFARQPAPIQASFLGYPCTTGLSRIQWFLSDRFREDARTTDCFSEQLFLLPESACCFQLEGAIPEPVQPPCLKRGYITLGSTHRLEKLSPNCLKLWSKVLERIPTARLQICRDVLGSSNGLRSGLLRRLSDAGISESRVDLCWQFGDHHLNFYSDIDILLDVFPWGSGTTAWECTWQGVPIPTIQDPASSSAATASLLMNSGFPELVAANEQEYIGIVERLSQHPAELSRLRFAMRPAMAKTVCDAQQYARQFEGSLRQMWMLYCEQYEAPAASAVDAESPDKPVSEIDLQSSAGSTSLSQLGDRWS